MEPNYLDIYYSQSYFEPVRIIPPRVRLTVAEILRRFAFFAGGLGILIFLILYAPSLVFVAAGGTKAPSLFFKEAQDVPYTPSPQIDQVYQPRLDSTLPLENYLTIPSLGINTKINEASYDNYEDALKVGVWRVPDFGTPYERKAPVILAAHRYGYLRWSVPYRLKNSFYNLPKLKVGETVEIVWRQRKYIYEIYGESKGEEVGDYSADLILYTCENLNSPIRIFKYGRLLKV